MATAILVSGMHRSGTSATAGALNLLGVTLGNNLLGPGADNPKGYWESTRAVDIHDKLLGRLDRSWDDVRELPDGWLQEEAAAQAALEIHELIDSEFRDAELWAIKDPRLCRFLPLWQKVLSERGIRAVVLLVARPPSEVAASLSKRNGWNNSVGELLWMRYVLDSEQGSRGLKRTVLTYDSLLDQPGVALHRALARLGVSPESGGSLAAEEDLAGFIDVSDRHHVRSNEGCEREISAHLWDLYVSLKDIEQSIGDWNGFQVVASRLGGFIHDRLPEITGLAGIAQGWRTLYNIQKIETLEKNSLLIAQIRWSEEAVVRERGLVENLAECKQLLRDCENSEGAGESQVAATQLLVSAVDLALSDPRISRAIDLINEFRGIADGTSRAIGELTGTQLEIGLNVKDLRTYVSGVAQMVQAIRDERDAGILEGFRGRIHDLEAECRELSREKAVEHARAQAAVDESIKLAVALQSECSSLAKEIATLTADKFTLRLDYDAEHRRAEEISIENKRLSSSLSLAESDGAHVRMELNSAKERAGELELREADMTDVIKRLAEEVQGLSERGEELLAQNKALSMENSAIIKSFSWRITRPARSMVEVLRRVFSTRR